MGDIENPADDARKATRTYIFEEILACNMCGQSSTKARTMGLRLDRRQGRTPKAQRGIAVSVCRCTDCGLVYANPQPRPRSIADHYGIPPESYWQENRLNLQTSLYDGLIANCRRFLGKSADIKVLDVGVGLGSAVHAMREAGFDVYGIETLRTIIPPGAGTP